jgi:hypothetical protein
MKLVSRIRVYGYLNLDIFVNILHPLWARARILAAVGALICPCGGYWGAQHPGTLLLPAFVRRPHTPTHYVLVVEIGRRPTAQCGPGWVINLEFQILVKDETDTIFGMEFLIEFSRTSLTGQTSHAGRKSCQSLLGWWTKDRVRSQVYQTMSRPHRLHCAAQCGRRCLLQGGARLDACSTGH